MNLHSAIPADMNAELIDELTDTSAKFGSDINDLNLTGSQFLAVYRFALCLKNDIALSPALMIIGAGMAS
jgi:hypothetical protein